ncbi:hypothetical protein BDN67DRAFT_1012176 [Paxillus ammoniavirescens]|nr:hypothetical protein BDN67DRAFT_1012176 [Paxillus ammoniavirescens]
MSLRKHTIPVGILATLVSTTSLARLEAERAQVEAAAASERARERAREIAREAAAKTITQVVLGSIITFSAGLDVSNLITGFETCTLHVKNLPVGVNEGEIRALFVLHGMDIERFHVVDIKRSSDGKLEARIVSDAEAGRVLASRLDGFEFRDDTLSVDVSANNTLEDMSAAINQDTDVLTISWRSPADRLNDEWIASQGGRVKKCPQCSVPIEKTYGCNHMTCR